MSIANVLSIAGSDPSGGAGIQADLKTFGALGAYGMAAMTALTAQNTRGVTGVHVVPPPFVVQQVDAVFADIQVDAVKVGMVATDEIASAVADALARHEARNVVVDPVMVAKGGHALLSPEAVAIVRDRLIPAALVVTPNLPEAGALLGMPAPASLGAMRDAARALHALGPRFVYLKGGHLDDEASIDVVFDGDRITELHGTRIRTTSTHGTGCTLSSAIAALLPQCGTPLEAMQRAKAFVTGAIAASAALRVGTGHGPVHHFHVRARPAADAGPLQPSTGTIS